MPTKQFIHSFEGGINQDLHKSVVQKNTSLEIVNFRPVASNTGTTGALETVTGNDYSYETVYTSPQTGLPNDAYRVINGTVTFNGSDYLTGTTFVVDSPTTPNSTTNTGKFVSTSLVISADNHKICGSVSIRNYLYIFTTTNTSSTPSGGESNIYEIILTSNGKISSCLLIYSDTYNGGASDYLNFSTANPIKAIARWETNDIRKIYWVDGYNEIRYAIVSNILTSDGNTYIPVFNPYFSTDKFSFLPNFSPNNIELKSIVSGNIPVGVIKYSYQLYSENGSETSFSPTTNFIHVSPSNEFNSNSSEYKGGSPDTNSGKGFKLKINTTNNDFFNKARVVAIHYSNLNETPQIRIAGEIDVDASKDEFYFTDNGSNLGEYTVEEFTILSSRKFKANDIVEKDNRLIACNITDDYFDIGSYDSRSYRFDVNGYSFIHESNGSGYILYRSGVNKYISGSAAVNDGDWEYFDWSGYHTGLDNSATLSDSSANWTTNEWVNSTIYNITDGSSGTITANTSNTITVTLSGGTDNDFDANDRYIIVTTSLSGNSWSIPETSDCINYYNDHNHDGRIVQAFDIDNTTIGSTGKNIDLKISTKDIVIDADAGSAADVLYESTDSTLLSSYTGFTNPYVSLKYKHLQSGEVYRVGIQFIDDKGRTSFVKWVNDFRVPYYGTTGPDTISYLSNVAGVSISATTMYLSLKVKSKPSGASFFRLMIVPRSSEDRTVRAMGLLERVNPNKPYYHAYGTIVTTDNTFRFISPEISFNRNISQTSSDRLLDLGYFDAPYTAGGYGTSAGNDHYGVKYYSSTTIYNWSSALKTRIVGIEDMAIVTPTKDYVNINGTNYSNYSTVAGIYAYGGTCLVIDPEDVSWDGTNPWSGHNSRTATIALYERNLFGSRYGGNTYEFRVNNYYIPLSEIFSTTGSFLDTYGGDVVTSYFDYLSLIWDLTKEYNHATVSQSQNEIIAVPLITTINTNLRSYFSYTEYPSSSNRDLIQEVGGEFTDLSGSGSYTFLQEGPLYEYNSVYSQYNDICQYPSEQDGFNFTQNFDTRVIYSEYKVNGEVSDSWTKFLSNNYIDIESSKGSVVNLYIFKNRLMFFQENGFGILSMNDRALIQDNNPGLLSLGTGGLFDRYDYISENIGNHSFQSITASQDALYWFYPDEPAIYLFNGTDIPISKVKGLSSWLKRNYANGDSVRCIYDNKYNEILFSIGSNNVLIYSEYIKAFSGFYSFNVDLFIDGYSDNILCTKYNLSNIAEGVLFTLNVDDISKRSTFYDSKNDSTIKFIVNPDYYLSKVFDNISFYSESYKESSNYYDSHQSLFTETFDKIRIYNDYQNTDWVTLTKGNNIQRRKRDWTLAIPRNVVKSNITSDPDIFNSSNLDSTQTFKERIRGNYCIVDLKLSSSSSSTKFVIPYINIFYRYSYR